MYVNKLFSINTLIEWKCLGANNIFYVLLELNQNENSPLSQISVLV
jgi:hypothetical protein